MAGKGMRACCDSPIGDAAKYPHINGCPVARSHSEALAVLRTHGSFEDAARASGMSVDAVRALWAEQPLGAVVDGPHGAEFSTAPVAPAGSDGEAAKRLMSAASNGYADTYERGRMSSEGPFSFASDVATVLAARAQPPVREAVAEQTTVPGREHIDRHAYALFPMDDLASRNSRSAFRLGYRQCEDDAHPTEPAARSLGSSAAPIPTEQADGPVVAWSEFEDDLSDAIQDSIDMDWNSRDGAKAVVRWLSVNVPLTTAGECAWLIEAPGANYLAVRTLGRSEFYWTPDHNKALRFASREQADQTAMAVRALKPDLWSFALTLGEAWPREHKWIDAHPAEPAAPDGPWEAHTGNDYAVVMLPDETTDSASIRVFSDDEYLPQRIANALNAKGEA